MRLVWGTPGQRFYETGVDRGVLYPLVGVGVPWNGLVSVTESPSGGEAQEFHFEGKKYLDVVGYEDFSATLEALSAPLEFGVCDGTKALAAGLLATQQPRTPFGLSYRTLIGNDVEGTDHGYKLHLVYMATALPSDRAHESLSDSPSPETKSWQINCTPPAAAGAYKPTSHFVVDSRYADPTALSDLEDLLYGDEIGSAGLPTQATVIALLS